VKSSAPPLIVIAGPTATGKTDLAIRLAEALIADGTPTVVISADSRQVYRGLDIGTAKASPAEQARVPHHGLDLVDPPDRFTVSDFVVHATAVLVQVAAGGGLAILAGGTGLYLRSIARGLPLEELPDDPGLRAGLEADLARDGLAALVVRLRSAAPVLAATVDLANPRRVVRAMELATLRGDGPRPAARGYDGASAWVGLDMSRDEHARRITSRAHQQFADGLVEEAVALRARYDPTLPCFSAIGYREAWAVADGVMTLDQAVEEDAARNVRFARRQRTWFRGEAGVTWLDATADPLPASLRTARAILDR